MQAMSEGMAALLKSGKQIGVNKPTHEVLIGGPGYTEPEFTSVKTIRGEWDGVNWHNADYGGGSFVTRADGKILVTYCNYTDNGIYLSIVDSEDDIFYLDNESETDEWRLVVVNNILTTPAAMAQSRLQKLSNGELLLYVLDAGDYSTNPTKLDCYKSENGLGTDFTLISTIYSYQLVQSDNFGHSSIGVGQAIQLSTGRILVPHIGMDAYSGNYKTAVGIVSISDDDGATWTNKKILVKSSALFVVTSFTCRGIGKFGDQLMIALGDSYGGGNMWFKYSEDDGDNWSDLTNYPGDYSANDGIHDGLFWGNDGYTYWINTIDGSVYKLYRHPDDVELPLTASAYDKINTWELMDNYTGSDDNIEVVWVTEQGHIAIAGTSYFGGGSIAKIVGGMRELNLKTLQAKSIQISRSKGMAGSLNIEFNNKDAILAPDGTTNPQLFWPNEEIVIKQGYGTELIQTFKGLIDSISMSTFPQLISISARDKMKVLLDHLARDSSFSYVLTYTGQTVEAIWQDLITKAGLTYGTVETTGITLTEKIFSWQTYADCISWLDEIAGFETYCDEFGVMHFVLDGRPETVTVAYEFDEGVDIIQLGYDIDDKDLYYSVVVYGKDANDAVIYYAATLPQAVYWNIPSGKVMRIDAPDADTEAKCQAIAYKAIYLMQTRARQVRFSTIGIPHLQRGDFIQVTEASSTISEIYRITDISTSQGPDGYTMELTCYYHAAPEV